MNADLTLTKDPLQAAALLASLEHKNPNECSYPTCHEPRQVIPGGAGRPSAYCSNPKHTAVNAHRARQQLSATAALEQATPSAKRTPVPVQATTESLRGSVLNRITILQNDLERYVTLLTELADPDVSAAHIKAALDQANAQIAEAQHNLSNEQALRLKAEADLLLAQGVAQSEREAAEQAILQMEEAEASAQRQVAEAERHVTDIQAERDTTVERMRIETQQRIQEIETQMKRALAQAQTETAKAQEETRLANIAALEARTQATTAERLVNEAQTSLERERAETDRLRKELEEVRTRAQIDVQEERRRAQADVERERTEIDRLRKELEVARKQAEQTAIQATNRIEKLTTLNDELRAQLVQAQTKSKEAPKH